jgi:hypothetical protein
LPSYFAVQLDTCPVDAPELGERVLYVEQAVMDQLDQPYRQRLYVVEPGPDREFQAVSRVFELNEPQAFAGACGEPARRTIGAAEAFERQGCLVALSWEGDHYGGSTPGTACKSDLNGALYATSEVALFPAAFLSWDRGFNAAGQQVWGATDGAYVFERRTPMPPPEGDSKSSP